MSLSSHHHHVRRFIINVVVSVVFVHTSYYSTNTKSYSSIVVAFSPPLSSSSSSSIHGPSFIKPVASTRASITRTSRNTFQLHAIITNENIRPGRLIEYLPPSAKGASASSSSTSNSGPIPILGTVLEPDGKKNWKILTASGKKTSVHPRTIQHILPGIRSVEKINEQEGLEAIQQHKLAATTALEEDQEADGAEVAEIWELLLDDDETLIDLATLSDLLCGDSSSISCYATRAALLYGVENSCFKPSSKVENSFEIRTAEVVSVLRAKAKVEREEVQRWEALKERISSSGRSSSSFVFEEEDIEVQQSLLSLKVLGCLANLEPNDKRESIVIEDYLKSAARTTSLTTARTFLRNLDRKQTPASARDVLVLTGIWNRHTHLDLIRLDPPIDFSSSLQKEADDLVSGRTSPVADVDADRRRDLTHLNAYAIDEASTMEIDDALSLELSEDKKTQRIWIHIADPTRTIPLNSPLANEAMRRTSSIYLPTGTIPMFPLALAAGPLCLEPGTKSCALSVGIRLGADGGVDYDNDNNDDPAVIITPSYVKTERLTYRQVDRILCSPGEFESMHGTEEVEDSAVDGMVDSRPELLDQLRRLKYVADQRLAWRKAGGSLESIGDYELPDMSVKASPTPSVEDSDNTTNDDGTNNKKGEGDDGWEVTIIARKRFAASRIVTELMLLANEAIATYGNTHAIPLPYRSQTTFPVSEETIEATPEGPCRSWLAIRSTTKTVVSANGGLMHEGLGLDAYVQATSPVRRFGDLAVHYQLKAFLRGDSLPFTGGGDDTSDDDESNNDKEDIVRLSQQAGTISRQLERSAQDYWLKEYLQRQSGEPVSVFILGADRRLRDTYKVLLPELGAIFDYKSSRPLEIGSQLELKCGDVLLSCLI